MKLLIAIILSLIFTLCRKSKTESPVPGQYSKDTIAAGYEIEFVNFHPYPGTYTDNSPHNSKAEVKVTRL